jgi:PhzF family phenazine biosynthesis protein
MQAAAAGFGHETCFVLGSDEDVRLRYFVPRHEMEMCVHATVAATVLRGRGGPVRTPLGVREVTLGADGQVVVEQSAPETGAPLGEEDVREVLAALGAREDDLGDGPVVSVSTARAKLLVPIAGEDALDRLAPDSERLWAVCDRLGVTGAYPFTRRAEGADAAARQFPVRAGYDEDPATGVAACALGAYLAVADGEEGRRRYEIAQGRAMGRPSRIVAEAQVAGGVVTATRVGGRAEVVRGPEEAGARSGR